jgi:dihydroxyacetone kinase-like protein
LGDGLAAVQERGKAKPGDKTMVDALAPAAGAAAQTADAPLDQALPPVAESARLGMEKTKQMVAATGKAMALGSRALGHVDPGALSMWLILQAMTEFVRGE